MKKLLLLGGQGKKGLNSEIGNLKGACLEKHSWYICIYATMICKIMRCDLIQEDIWRCRQLPEQIHKFNIGGTFWKDLLYS